MRCATVNARILLLCAFWLMAPTGVVAQTTGGRTLVESIAAPPLEFEQPEVQRHDVDGVPVLVLERRELPLVTAYAYFKGGYGLFGREHYASAMGLPSLLRYGGTTDLPPESVDELLEFHAIQTSFGSAGGSVFSSMNTLTEHLSVALELWGDMLARPRFDTAEIAVWRGRQLESVRRRGDDPTRLAFSEFNRLLFGDHPIGWEMTADDLTPELITSARFHAVHGWIACRENLVLGITGDIAWDQAEPHLAEVIEGVPACASELPESPAPDILRTGGVFLIERDLEQAVIVMAHPTGVNLGDTPEYFSAMIGNAVLGAGGFSSRILGRVRTERGYAYGASSLWTTPREHQGILGAVTRTSPENAVPAIEVILEAMAELRDRPPSEEEVGTAVDQVVNGFVFNFANASQILSRTMLYLAQELPEDWLERYWRGVQRVTPRSVRRVFRDHLRPDEMTILIVGDPARIGWDALQQLGPVTVLPVG